MKLNIKGLYVTLSISDTVRNIALHYAECCILFIVMLSVIMLSVIMLSVIMLSVIMLSVIMLSVIMLSVIMLSVVILSVVAPPCIFSLAFMMFWKASNILTHLTFFPIFKKKNE